MISQTKLNELIADNKKQIDELSKLLSEDPSLISQPYPLTTSDDFLYSNQLTRVVAEGNLLKKFNGQ